MGWVAYYTVLLSLFVASFAYSAAHPGATSRYIHALSGALPVLSALAQAVARTNFRVYLWSQRVWIRIHASRTSNWRFAMRLDGNVGADAIQRLGALCATGLSAWNPRIDAQNSHQLSLVFDRTVRVKAQYESVADSSDLKDHLLLYSDELEITYASAQEKIEKSIVPFMNAVLRDFSCLESSITLNVHFGSKNPFFTFFVAHLRQDQVVNFNLIFRPHSIARGDDNKVVVTKDTISIQAATPDSFATLSKAFLLLNKDAAAIASL